MILLQSLQDDSMWTTRSRKRPVHFIRIIFVKYKPVATNSTEGYIKKILLSLASILLSLIFMSLIDRIGWQLANEPQEGPREWFEEISKFIKEGAPNHLVSSGIESKLNETDFLNAHGPKEIDYCSSHCWVEK